LNISEKLLEIRTSSGKSQADFAKLAGVSQRTWSSYESGQTTPKMGVLWTLAACGYPIKGLTTDILGDMVEEGKISKAELQKKLEIARAMAEKASTDTPIDDEWAREIDAEYKRQNFSVSDSTPVYSRADIENNGNVFVIPLLSQKLSAGNGQELPQQDDVTALIPIPNHLAKYGKNLAALTVEGDSMYPTLDRGDMVVCDSCGWSGEGVYAMRMGGDGFVKRLTKAPGKLVIISDNPKYPVREEPEESQDFEIIGRVHCAIKNME
jgi:phage repressor protein C with HTH and peptisase S24 domain/DNA-binding XRE family transcriptional regulator